MSRASSSSGGPAREPVALHTPLTALGCFTPALCAGLAALGLTNVGRLVAHLPMRHERVDAEAAIAELEPDRIITARGEITATRVAGYGRKRRLQAVLHDGTGRLDLVFFNMPYMVERVKPGLRVRVEGKVKRVGSSLQLANPKLQVLDDEEPGITEAILRPVYPAGEGLTSAQISRAIRRVLPEALPLIDDHLPPEYRAARALPELREAYRQQHDPRTPEEIADSRRRLAYDELLLLQLAVHLRRAQVKGKLQAPALSFSAAVDAQIRAHLPHVLTPGQERVVREIVADLALSTPANRLIQGDVGSGKTLVALYAILLAVVSRHQAALMAPTEILAEQHAASISRALKGSSVRVALLTGNTPQPQREAILREVAEGGIDILVGTHALLTESVRFASLAVAVIDEQHRFGVHQRARLREKASDPRGTPHVLVMTATPIPRTLALTLFGDLDISVISGLPPGRQSITTRVFSDDARDEVYAEVDRRLAQGDQAYVVAPAIEAGDALPDGSRLKDVRSLERELSERFLPGRRIALMHGQLSRETRDAVMERFRAGSIQVLVATTVIEVGVDVPNATVMVVEQADRFGLAQLHQLRGRVGRGSKPSSCYMIADPRTDQARERLAVLETSTDGFLLAEKDLELRGPADVFGSRQSGAASLKVADLMRDRELLNLARKDAAAWIARSPDLAWPEEATLRRRVLKAHGEAFDLGDVG